MSFWRKGMVTQKPISVPMAYVSTKHTKVCPLTVISATEAYIRQHQVMKEVLQQQLASAMVSTVDVITYQTTSELVAPWARRFYSVWEVEVVDMPWRVMMMPPTSQTSSGVLSVRKARSLATRALDLSILTPVMVIRMSLARLTALTSTSKMSMVLQERVRAFADN